MRCLGREAPAEDFEIAVTMDRYQFVRSEEVAEAAVAQPDSYPRTNPAINPSVLLQSAYNESDAPRRSKRNSQMASVLKKDADRPVTKAVMNRLTAATLSLLAASLPASAASKIFPYAYNQEDLSNGLRLITIPTDYPNIVSVFIVVSGSRNEVSLAKAASLICLNI